MSSEDVVQGLRLAHFLRGLSEAELVQLASLLTPANYEPGQILLNLGDPLDAAFLILDGEVELTAYDSNGDSRLLTRLSSGAVAGLLEFFAGRTIQVRVTAHSQVHALRWEREALTEFLAAHPGALASLKLAARSQQLAFHLNLDWLHEAEVVVGLARKHPVMLVLAEILPAILLATGIGLGIWASTTSSLFAILGGVLGLAGAGYAVWQWVDWQNDYYIVTNRRIVRLEKIVALYDSRQEAPLHQVLSVSVSTDAISRLLGYGDVVIRTYTGEIIFPHIGLPKRLAAMIEEQWRRQQIVQKASDRQDVEKAVRQVLSTEPAVPDSETEPDVPDQGEEAATDPERAPQLGLDHWGFQLRFESEGVVTYRKHWAVLLQHIGLPSLLILAVFGLVGARLGSLAVFGTVQQTLEFSGLALIPLVLWWLYQYADWANDIYQVTPTHIIDVYKRPLGRELRKVAPLENLLSTEVDRRGLIGILLNFGDVTANVGTEVLDFEGVFNPGAVQQDVVRAQEAFNARRRQSERQQRQDEMVEWLSVYHEQVSGQDPEKKVPKDLDDYP
jgi:hypothetical protein